MWISGPAIVIDRHVIAGISIAGTLGDVMGGLYLAYDLLGGNNGPLRTLTRVMTYSLIFCIGYGLPFGLIFGATTRPRAGVSGRSRAGSNSRTRVCPRDAG